MGDRYAAAPRVTTTPDFSQFHEALPWEGGAYCGPSAAGNAILWLGNNGYPNLLPEAEGEAGQIELVKALASKRCMNTGEKSGTGPTDMVKGLVAYAEARGYEVEEANYQGWKSVPKAYEGPKGLGPDGHADPDRAFDNLKPNTIVLLHLGWYRIHVGKNERVPSGPDFTRLGGHWVTLVGRKEPYGISNAEFVIHDPADIHHDRGAAGGRDDRVDMGPIPAGGHLYDRGGKTLVRCEGIHGLDGELRINTRSGANFALLDGVLVFRLRPPAGE